MEKNSVAQPLGLGDAAGLKLGLHSIGMLRAWATPRALVYEPRSVSDPRPGPVGFSTGYPAAVHALKLPGTFQT